MEKCFPADRIRPLTIAFSVAVIHANFALFHKQWLYFVNEKIALPYIILLGFLDDN